MDLLSWGKVKLAKGADGSHVFIDTHDLVGYMGKFFAEGRLAQINELLAKFPKLTWEEVHHKYRDEEDWYGKVIEQGLKRKGYSNEITAEKLEHARVRLRNTAE